ncbi:MULTISPECIES: ABC transporter permease [unclassified Oceanispirochaeta]|uniref:ABC transporter permease n=1 Tax=unclassified Oceanispirochaeta TaxID=2635722 RepID=UPI000E09B4C0|nr:MULTISPECIES: ABC transporter permease [unclassified Oceanispirochaeta]MBF9017110.1 ABC transporter permease [Oceanispirochaeta sp. M2]NPD73559.1 ABC transporter permease [Oceanispirochaeta sp. M1]RDG30663.1 ABC transporter permease [Oceanispirochaeta sp. M1]
MILVILASATPLILAALGGLLTERAGVLNIALEGMILGSAFAAVLIAGLSGSIFLGTLGALFAGMLISMLFNLGTFTLKGNPFITGLGINVLVPALTVSISQRIYGNQGIIRPENISSVFKIAGMDMFTITALAAAVIMLIVFFRTRQGLIIRSCGEQEDLLISRGINPVKVKKQMVLLSGAFSGLAGGALSLNLGVYVPGMSAGKGWIALVAIYLGYRRIPGVVLACILFSMAEWGANRAQGFLGIPPTLILSFPYFLTLAALWLFSIRKSRSNTGL